MSRVRTVILGCLVVAALVLTACAGGEGGAAALDDLDVAQMESYGCGYGFHLGTAADDVALRVIARDFARASNGDLPQEAELPHDVWDAVVLVGSDLYANWCDDVIEDDEPEPEIEEEWPITAGRITLHGDVPEDGGCPGGLTASLEDLEVTRDDGTTVDLGSREVENTAWGCFAG